MLELKRLCSYACANRSIASDKIEIEIQSMGETNIRKITQKDLAAIVQPRIQEILSFVLKTINDFQLGSITTSWNCVVRWRVTTY